MKDNDKISKDIKDDFIDAYNTIPNKTKIKFHNKFYRQYVMEPVDQYYIEKNVLADDEKSIIRDDNISFDDDSKDKSLKDKLKSDVTKTIVKTLTG